MNTKETLQHPKESPAQVGTALQSSITRCLTISTAHISEDTAIALKREPDTNEMWLSVYPKAGYGFWVFLPEDMMEDSDDKHRISEDLWNCMLLAHKNDCQWLCLDCDGAVIDGLATYEW